MGRWRRETRLNTAGISSVFLVILAAVACGTATVPATDDRSDGAVADAAPIPQEADADAASPVDAGTAVDGAVDAGCPAGTFSDCSPMTLASCTVPPLPAAGDITWLPNIVYSTPYRGTAGAQPQALDLAVPKVARGAPFVVIVHGGGWRGGDKSDHRDDLLRLAGQGYVAAAINYRLVNSGPVPNRAPAAASDTRCAIRWAKSHAASYGADPNRVVAVGASAGANLVALLGTSPNDADLDAGSDGGACETTGAPNPAGIVSYYGRMDLRRPPIPDYLVDYIGRDGDWLGREAANSPALHVTRAAPPFLLIHGQADGTVPVEQSRLFHDALDGASVPNALVELPGQEHGFPLFATTPGLLPASCSTLQFLSHFQPEPPVARPQRTVVYVL
jgi:acetyl esterase/lipase